MKNSKCTKIRYNLQQALDQRKRPNKEITSHLEKCVACREFYKHISTLPSLLTRTLNKAITRIPAPNYNAIFNKTEYKKSKHTWVRRIISLAASVLIVIGSIFVYKIIDRYQTATFVKEETHYFMEELFSTLLMQDVEYQAINEIEINLD